MNSIEATKEEIKKKYQYDIGSSGALLLLILAKQHTENKQLIEAAAATINKSQKPLQTNNSWVAFCFGLGKNISWGLPLLMTIGLAGWFYSQNEDFKSIRAVVTQYPNADKFKYLMQDGHLESKSDGSLNLVLTSAPNKEEMQAGLHYIYDKECECVYVPLEFDRK